MKKFISIFLSLTLLISSSAINTVFAAEGNDMNVAYKIYVNQNGGNENTFKTIKEAQEYVRTLDKSKGDIVIEIADGIYELDEPLSFTPTDSGSENCTIRYVAAPSSNPIISGGKEVSGNWQYEGNGIYSIDYDRDEKLRSLYVNGKRCYMTSKVIKGKGAVGEYNITAGQADWAWVDGTASDGVIFKKDSIPLDTRNPEDIELMTQTRWNTTIVCVDSLEKHGLNICAKLQMPYAAIAQTLGWGNEYQFKENNLVSNVFEYLDEPGEFYFDKGEKRLYYYPRANEDLRNAKIVVPELENLINIQGENLENRVKNISFEGIEFAYTDWNLYDIDGSHGRATNQGAAALTAYAEEDWHGYIYRAYDVGPAAISVSSAENITFDSNTVCHTGNDGISLVNDATSINITGNVVYDTAGASLLIGHPQHEYIGDKGSDFGNHSEKEKYDATVEGVCSDILVKNNLFKDTSRLFWGVAGIMVYITEGLEFVHNQVENTTYSGISLGWGWWNMNGDSESVVPSNPSDTMKNNTIKYNYFKNTVTTLSDSGAIYTIGDMPGTVISENYIDTVGSDFSNNAYHVRGIHIDEGTRHVYGEKNVIDINPEFACIDCGDWGKKGENTWDNNYSTSSSYTTTETYEPDTVITNKHYVPDKNWDKTALEVINNAGIEKDIYDDIDDEVINREFEIIKAIPDWKPNVGLIVGLSVGGAVVVAAAAAAVITTIIKKKRKGRQ